jgi:2-dehydropantoate 2-reductase
MKKDGGFNPQKFAVIGAGPVGCVVAAFLAKGGYDVTVCDIIPELVEPTANPGITIEGIENFKQAVTRTCTHVDELADIEPDVIIIAAKANALPLIASAIESFYKEGMYVVSWQNGINTEQEIAEVLGKKAAMRAVVNYGCSLISPAYVYMAFHHHPHFIQELDPESKGAAEAIVKVLCRAGLPTEYTDQVVSIVWRKGILNSAMNPVCAVTGMTMSESMNDPIIFQIVSSLLKECIKVARANEISLGWDFFPKAIAYLQTAGNHKPSMLLDIENNKKTEIDFMNGKFIEYGQQANIDTPYNSTLRALVKGLESKNK